MRALLLIAAFGMVAAPVSAAKPCRDAHGKFIKCAKAAPAKAKPCRDAKGHFTKCKK
jgi:hypothetical protein